ncbi:hypothetical protein PUN28_016161 [Cardiocondyla obscurior]|uniref:Uncharacterized protein n=1 Tax=Cardiocondyla obscurior TaxID=286306 RepID=A0AAW2EX65_9HYME
MPRAAHTRPDHPPSTDPPRRSRPSPRARKRTVAPARANGQGDRTKEKRERIRGEREREKRKSCGNGKRGEGAITRASGSALPIVTYVFYATSPALPGATPPLSRGYRRGWSVSKSRPRVRKCRAEGAWCASERADGRARSREERSSRGYI